MSLSKTRQLVFYFCFLGVILIVYAEASALRPAKQEPSISIDVPHGALSRQQTATRNLCFLSD